MDNEGVCYSDDGSTLLSWTGNDDVCVVREGCRTIGYKAFMYQTSLKHVVLPSSVETLEPFAFSCTGLEELETPPHLLSIGEKALYQCKYLQRVRLNEGLTFIGTEAFSNTGLLSLHIPASVSNLGRGIIADTPLAAGQPGTALSISPDNPRYLVDAQGGLYRRTSNNDLMLVELLTKATTHHHILAGTTSIGQNAYRCQRSLKSVELPEGLRSIGAMAFRGCCSLRRAVIPESLESIGDEAFYDSGLEELYLPAGFSHLGMYALITGSKSKESTLHSIQVHPDCARFYTTSGLLCERTRSGQSGVVLRFGTNPQVIVPAEITTIGPYAFAGAADIQELRLPATMRRVHPRSFFSHGDIECVRVDLREPVCGRSYVEVRYPCENRMRPALVEAFIDGIIDVEVLCDYYDHAIYFMHERFGRMQRMLDRLTCPQFLTEMSRRRFEEDLTRCALEACRLFAQRGYTKGIEQLVTLGFLNERNIAEAIDEISELKDAAMTGYLLELRSTRLGGHRTDFSL